VRIKNVNYILGLLAIGFFLFFIDARISVAESPQSDSQSVWPALSPAQYYWYEPETGLTVEQADAVFNEVTTADISLMMSQFPKQVCTLKSARAVIGKTRKGKKANSGSIKLETEWAGYRKSYPLFMPLSDIQKMSLYYVSKAKNKWLLSISGGDNSYEIFFKDEDSARRFGSAVASLLAQEGLSLKFSKLGLSTADLTPEQAAALGKTRIESVLVTLVAIDGPADKANIQPLDVIIEINGVKVKNDSHCNSLIEVIPSGTKISLTYLRRTEVVEKDQKQFVWKPMVVEVTAK
jgi:hypothetical protein